MQDLWNPTAVLNVLPLVIGVSGAVVSLGAAIGGLAATRIAGHWRKLEAEARPSGLPPVSPTQDELERQLRVTESKTVQRRQEGAAKWFRRMSGALSGGQYLVGAALASAFVQSSLNPGLIGFLGLVVLLSQATRHAYRPELRAVGAAQRAIRLKEVIRAVEDDLYELGAKPAQPSLFRLRRRLTRVLAEVERLEADELATRLKSLEPEALQPERVTQQAGTEPAA